MSPPPKGKLMVIGSGPIVIGQAAEFDFSGSQACRSLREEGYQTVLVNSNPATIQTDLETADMVYIEPLNVETIANDHREGEGGRRALRNGRTDRPQPMLRAGREWHLGPAGRVGSWAPNREAIALSRGPRALQADHDQTSASRSPRARRSTPSRRRSRPSRRSATTLSSSAPAYTLGGTGGGIAYNEEELVDIVGRGLIYSRIHQVLIEESVLGWKEFEYEVMRDGNDNCVIICNMENLDAMGIHTGESIVIAPVPDAQRRGPPEAEDRVHQDHPCPEDRGRLQRPVRPEPGDQGVPRHRGEPPCLQVIRPGLQGHRLPHRQGGGQDRRRQDPGRDTEPDHREDLRRLRADPRLRGAEDPPLALRQVPHRRQAARHPDEVHRGGHGHRTDHRGEHHEGRPLPGDRQDRPGAENLERRGARPASSR